MQRPPHAARRSLLSITLLGLTAGCGSDATGPQSNESLFTVAEATTVASAILTEVSRALSTGAASDRVPAGAVVPTTVSQSVNAPCAAGGTITGKFTVTMDIGSNGTGTESGTMTVTPKGCKVSTGTRVIAVDGQLTYTFDFALSQNAQLTQFKWHGFGEFTWSGGSCKVDYTMNLAGNKSTISGSFCGINISSSQ